MPVETLLVSSVELLALGMGAVFVILSLMIACMTILCRCAPEEEAKPVPHPSGVDSRVFAVIQAAVDQYRDPHKSAA